MKNTLFALSALAVAGALSTTAAADERADPPSRTILTSGVDFHDPAAVNSIYLQMRRAAEDVCDTYAANSRVTAADRACASKALALAVRRANQPTLTSLFERETRPAVGRGAR